MPSDALRTTVLLELWRTSRRSAALLEDAFEHAPLTPAEFGLYSLIRFQAPLTVTEVSQQSGSPITTISQVLKRIEQRGDLQRAPNPDDARSTVVSLTEAGVAAHVAASDAFRPVINAINEQLGSDLTQVVFSLVRLDRALRVLAGEPPAEDELGDRPPHATAHDLTYAGEPLTPDEQTEARAFIDWLRHRRSGLAEAG